MTDTVLQWRALDHPRFLEHMEPADDSEPRMPLGDVSAESDAIELGNQ